MSDFTFDPEHITQFKTGVATRRVWASLSNERHPAHPEAWSFGYEPLFSPETNEEGLSVDLIGIADRWRLRLAIYLASDQAQELAYEALKTLYPKFASRIRKQNVSAIPVRGVSIRIDDLGVIEGATLVQSRFQSRSVFTVQIEFKNREDEALLRQVLSNATIEYAYSFSAKKRTDNVVRISSKDLASSRLVAELKGPASRGDGFQAYVHRDDVRNLTRNIMSEVEVVGVIEDPDRFSLDFTNTLLERYGDRFAITEENFNNVKDQTYHADDLKPSVIQEHLNKAFTKTDDKYELNKEWSGNINTKMDMWGDFFSGEAGGGASYSKKELEEKLRERSIEIQFKGNDIVVKSVEVHQLSIKQLTSENDVISVFSYISGPVSAEERGSIELWRTSQDQLGVLESKGREEYWREQVRSFREEMVGVVCAYPGDTPLPSERWKMCNGEALRRADFPVLFERIGTTYGVPKDVENPNDFFLLPDFRGCFLRTLDDGKGIDSGRLLNVIQRHSTALPENLSIGRGGEHSHRVYVGGGGRDTLAGGLDVSEVPTTLSGINLERHPGHDHPITGGDAETRPVNYAIRRIICVQ